MDRATLVAIHEGRALAGVRLPDDASNQQEDSLYEVVAVPARRVAGRVGIDQLKDQGDIGRFGGTAAVGKYDPFQWSSPTGDFYLWLPPGEYEFHASGTYGHEVRQPLRVEAGTEPLRLEPIDLPPTALGLLLGKPALELRGVNAWKNSDGVTLADLRGRYVILHFWGHWCGPCVVHMPRLFAAYERYGRDKLEIIGVHVGGKENSVETVEQLDKLLTEIRTEYWAGRDLPFPVALSRSQATQHFGTTRMARSVAAADYGIVLYPTEILIGPDGKVIGAVDRALGAKDWVEMDRLLGRE